PYEPQTDAPLVTRGRLSSIPTALTIVRFLFFFTNPAPTDIYTLSLHDALPISSQRAIHVAHRPAERAVHRLAHPVEDVVHHVARSEEHTSELQSRFELVCRLLLEKKK